MFKDDQSKEQTPTSGMFADQLKNITNEEGTQKYDTVDKALEALSHSQSFIKQLQTDNAKLKAQEIESSGELSKREELETIVSRLMQKQEQPAVAEASQPAAPVTSEQSIEDVVANLLRKQSTETSANDNKQKVISAFTEKFGVNASQKFQELAQETGITVKELEELSAKSPAMVLKLVPEPTRQPSVTSGSFNTSAFSPPAKPEGVQPPTVSVLAGATSKDLKAEMLRHKEAVYKKYGVTQ